MSNRDLIDTRDLGTVQGFTLRADMVYDDSERLDDDCYTDEDRFYYRDDAWHFVGIVVTALAEGLELGSASIWGMEYGDWSDGRRLDPLEPTEGDEFANGYGSSLIDEAIAEARKTLTALAPLVAEALDDTDTPLVCINCGQSAPIDWTKAN